MSYTLGVFENAIKQVKDRITSYTATGKTLSDIKSVLIGSRPIDTNSNTLPRIVININQYQDDSYTMAYSGGQKQALLTLEIRLISQKIMNKVDAKYANNVLFDSEGKGGLSYFQHLNDALIFKSDSAYSPTLDLQLDGMPDTTFNAEETATTIELLITLPLRIRYTLGTLGGTLT